MIAVLVLSAFQSNSISIGANEMELSRNVAAESTPTPRVTLLRDDFSEPTTFGLYDGEDAKIDQQDQSLAFAIFEPETFAFSPLDTSFEDVTIEVDASMVGGPYDNGFGVACRISDVGEYDFEISSDGYFAIFLWNETDGYVPLIDWTRSSAIHTGEGHVNHITATCLGNQLSLSVNGHHLATVVDESFSEGNIALLAESFDKADVAVNFDNVELLDPSEARVSLLPEDSLPLISDDSIELPYSDDFSGPSSWWHRQGVESSAFRQEDTFSLMLHTPQWQVFSGLGSHYEDVIIDVDVEMVAGPLNNAYGVSCRMSVEQQYMFNISSNGFYRIFLYKAEDESVYLVDWRESDVIKTGQGQVNHITATCLGDQLTLAVNGQELASVTDDTISGGDVALIATSYQEGGVSIEYDNVEVIQPSE